MAAQLEQTFFFSAGKGGRLGVWCQGVRASVEMKLTVEWEERERERERESYLIFNELYIAKSVISF